MEEQNKNGKNLIYALNQLSDNSVTASEMKNKIKEWKEAGVELKDHVNKIFDKLGINQNGIHMTLLLEKLKEAGVDLNNHVDKIFGKLEVDQLADDMASLVKELKEAKVELKDHVGEIFDKLKASQSASHMARLVKELKEAGVDLNNHVDKIFGKLGVQSANYMASLVKEFNEAKVDLNNHVDKIFDKLEADQSAGDMANLVKELNVAGVELNNHAGEIFDKLEADQSVGDMANLVKELKKVGVDLNNGNAVANRLSVVANIKLAIILKKDDINLAPDFFDNSLLDDKFSKDQNNIKNIDSNKTEFEKVFSKELIKYFGQRLKKLKLNELDVDNEKKFWTRIVDDLEKEELLSEDKAKECKNKISAIDSLNGFVTFLQWLGCVLSIPCSLGLSLISNRVKNRVCFRTKSARIFERLQNSKDELIAPLQKIANFQPKAQQENDRFSDH